MTTKDTEDTSLVLQHFQEAWELSIDDYKCRKLNSEHCLQASVYRHLVNSLPNTFSVYTEAVVRLSENAQQPSQSKVKIDLLICKGQEIIAAIEIKYTPRGQPKTKAIQKDLASLSHITKRRNRADRCSIEMNRFYTQDSHALSFKIPTQRKLIFAAVCASDSSSMSKQQFWKTHRPPSGYWSDKNNYPTHLCVAMAYTNSQGGANSSFFAPGFDRINKKKSHT